MSTNSGIALRAGETFNTIYCHWNGHPKDMLPILRGHYNSFELANKLISMGDASMIEAKIDPDPARPHDFNNYQEDVCVFYYRDRGDDWLSCQSACYTKSELFKVPAFDYVYIFEDGTWNAYNMNGRKVEDNA